MLSFFKKKRSIPSVLPVNVDVHSHLLPGIDDGVKTFDESLAILKEFIELGYEKVITTPHIFTDHYPNTPEIILEKLSELKTLVKQEGLSIEIKAAAEYYLDETLLQKLQNKEHILSFGDQYLLFETSFINKPTFLIDAIFQISSSGYRPVMAHPERYNYMLDDDQLIKELRDREVLFQINLNSLTGYYSKTVKKLAEKLIDKGYVDFVGTDCHNMRHVNVIKDASTMKYYKKVTDLQLLNYTL